MIRSRFVKGKNSVFGEVADSWFRFEEQGRGSLHLHLLLWLKKEPIDASSPSSDDDTHGHSDNSAPRYAPFYVLAYWTLPPLGMHYTFQL